MEKKSAMQYVRLHTCDMGPSRRTGGRKDGRTAQAKVQLAAPKLHGKEWLSARWLQCANKCTPGSARSAAGLSRFFLQPLRPSGRVYNLGEQRTYLQNQAALQMRCGTG